MDNRGYAILRDTLEGWQGPSARTGTFVATELDDPPLDFLALAASMGVAATSVRSTAELTEVATAAVTSGLPHLLHIPIPAPQDT